ncbi:MAG TPA: sigma-70 family RNA polymerase sigma factor [Candidatus Polarisedimenticolaceae bacterium]|nr:sigma-70 family RNA polymerase sigma factor [Candidatus Polarisedimenticolaceae bacterium]
MKTSHPDTKSPVPPSREVTQVVEHCFRHESGKIISTLTRIFGIEHINRAEDLVQETLVRALQTWPYYGIPQNPAAWITQVAKNLALDVIRREKTFHHKEVEIARLIDQDSTDSTAENASIGETAITDDRLRMMFVCCHPVLPQEAHVALALKTLCGFSAGEIARAFLTSEAAIAKRLTRAKKKIREVRVPFEIPAGDELAQRLDGVLQTLYLLFNEGYKASKGDQLIREALCHEAIRLGGLLAEHPAGNRPRTHALLALMLLNGARLKARLDQDGNILRLKEQTRSSWDQAMIARGLFHLMQSIAGEEISEYHLQAGIAACHCAAKDYESTDWSQILSLYDRLVEMNDSPVILLNRAVALANVHGPRAGIEAVQAIQNRQELNSYYLLYAVLGEFEADLNNKAAAANYFRRSMEHTTIRSEQIFMSTKLKQLDAGSSGSNLAPGRKRARREMAR